MADLNAYFSGLGIASAPKVVAVSVDHGKNHPTGDPNGPDGEVMLDIEVVGAVAPQANIAVYFAPNTDAGFLDAVTTAIHDATNKPSVISISWGGPESSWTAQSLSAFDDAFQAAAAIGITVCVASGDNGSSDGATDGGDHVDFPASSPHALACGGTRLEAAGGAVSAELVWNDGAQGGAGGGGVSSVFALPAWQDGLHTTKTSGGDAVLNMRGVPDVSGDADPQTGYAGADRRHRHRDRRDQRGGAAVGRSDRPRQRGQRQPGRLDQPGALRKCRRVARHLGRQQRNLCGGSRLGRLHRARQPGRRENRRSVRIGRGHRIDPDELSRAAMGRHVRHRFMKI